MTDYGARNLAAAILRKAVMDKRGQATARRELSAADRAWFLHPDRLAQFWHSPWADLLAELAGVDPQALRRALR